MEGSHAGLLVVLEMTNKLTGPDRTAVDATYFANQVRNAVLRSLPGVRLIPVRIQGDQRYCLGGLRSDRKSRRATCGIQEAGQAPQPEIVALN